MSSVDLLVILGILGVLVAVLGHQFSIQLTHASQERTALWLNQLKSAGEIYAVLNETAPPDLDALTPLLSPDAPPLTDTWGNRLQYEAPGPGGTLFVIRSLGADGEPGGVGIDADQYAFGSTP